MAIKMKVNTNKDSKCNECGVAWKNTKEMWDVYFIDKKYTICFDCMEILFHKSLTATCNYNGKIKSQEDQKRMARSNAIKNPVVEKEPEYKPSCFGMFQKKKACKECEYLSECKVIWEDSQWEEV
jgi:hypothetical protein